MFEYQSDCVLFEQSTHSRPLYTVREQTKQTWPRGWPS